MSDKVYAVWHGSYSDYHIRAVFSTREKAEKFKDVTKSDGIHEYTLDPPQREWGSWYVIIDAGDGSVLVSRFDTYEADPNREPKYLPKYLTGAFVGYGMTEEGARRSAEECRREHKAFGGG